MGNIQNNLGSIRIGAPLPIDVRAGYKNPRSLPLTSISHFGHPETKALTSVSRLSRSGSVGGSLNTTEDGAITENLRKTAIAKRMKEKRLVAATKPAVKANLYKLGVAPGKMQRTTGVTSFKHSFKELVRTHRATFGNLANVKDGKKKRDFFIGIVEERIKNKRIGSEWDRHDRLHLKTEVNKAHHRGDILKQDKIMFRKIINTLKPN